MSGHDEIERRGRGEIVRFDRQELGEPGDTYRFEYENTFGEMTEGIALEIAEGIVAFENVCPHLGFALDCHSPSFDYEGDGLLECDAHGAQFEIDSGRCVAGPCKGDRLEVFEVEVDETAEEVIVRSGSRLRL